MTMTDRDKKLLAFLLPVAILAAYWFLVLAPVRNEGGQLGDQLAKQVQKRDQLQARVARLGQARTDFAADYATVVELGKAVPTTVDMPSLIVQLDKASKGTRIAFQRIQAGERLPAAAGPASSGSAGASSATGTPAAAAGGAKAATGPGKAVEKANDTKAKQDAKGGAPSGGAPAAAGGTSRTSGVAGLDAVPLQFTFRGSFFDLADFFHRMKRFVHVVGDRVDARGRLMTIEGIDFKSTAFPRLEAQITAKVYLTPKKEGATAGASPGGPAAPAGGSQTASSPAPGPSPAPSATTVAR